MILCSNRLYSTFGNIILSQVEHHKDTIKYYITQVRFGSKINVEKHLLCFVPKEAKKNSSTLDDAFEYFNRSSSNSPTESNATFDACAVDLVKLAFNNCELKAKEVNSKKSEEVKIYRQWLLTVQLPKLIKSLPSTSATSQFGVAFAKLAFKPAKLAADVLVRKKGRNKVRLGVQNIFQQLEVHIKDKKSIIWTGASATGQSGEKVSVRINAKSTVAPKINHNINEEMIKNIMKEIKEENSKIEQPDLLLMSRDAAARSELEKNNLALHVIACDPRIVIVVILTIYFI